MEPLDTTGNLPKCLCVAWSLTTINSDGKIILQVMNISPDSIKVYKGMKLGQMVSRHNILEL